MERKPMRIGALDIVVVIVAALIVVGVLTFAGPCVHEDGSEAMCTSAGRGILILGIAALIAAVVRLFTPKLAKAALAVVDAVLGAGIALLPGTLVPLCMMETMRCQAVMKPTATLLGIVLAIASAVAVVQALRGDAKPRRSDSF